MNQKIEINRHENKERCYVIRYNPGAANAQNISARIHSTHWSAVFSYNLIF